MMDAEDKCDNEGHTSHAVIEEGEAEFVGEGEALALNVSRDDGVPEDLPPSGHFGKQDEGLGPGIRIPGPVPRRPRPHADRVFSGRRETPHLDHHWFRRHRLDLVPPLSDLIPSREPMNPQMRDVIRVALPVAILKGGTLEIAC